MKAIMNLNALKNTEELQSFLNGSQAVAFSLPGKKEERYAFVQSTLKQLVLSQELVKAKSALSSGITILLKL
jgi:hypothetical protein